MASRAFWYTGDRVRLRADTGGFFRPRLRRGAEGIIVAVAEDGSVWVKFTDQKLTDHVAADRLEPA